MRNNKDRYANMSPTKRFFHKYTGFIFVGIMLCTVVPYLIWVINSYEFFEGWSCQTIQQYVLLDWTFGNNPTHDQLTESQHLRLHEVMEQCNFGTALKHDD